MKKLLILLLVFPIIVFSQCPTDGEFNSQAEIDAFATDYPDCSQLSLTIEGDDITDLSGLNQITNASFLTISNNPVLQTLDGLNPSLIFYSPAQPTFSISNNTSLLDISALATASANAEFDIYVIISDNPLLSNLNGIQCFTWATTFTIRNNDSLTSLEELENVSTSQLTIDDNDNLIDLTGIVNYDNDYVTISNNVSLESLNMQNVIIGNLTISNNPNLTDINLPTNSGVWETLTIENNSNLSICNVEFVCVFIENMYTPYAINIQNNLPGCNSLTEIEVACGIAPFNDDCYPSFFITVGETIQINNEYATTSLQTPSCNDFLERQDLWFTFNSGDLTSVDIIAEAGFSLQLWEGDCNNLMQIDNACASGSLIDVSVTPDTYYILQVWSSDTGRRASGWFDVLVQDGLLSTPEFESNAISIFPNPVQNELHIQSNLPIERVEVYNLLGQQVIESNATTLDVFNLTEGLYLVKVFSNGRSTTYKIVKQ